MFDPAPRRRVALAALLVLVVLQPATTSAHVDGGVETDVAGDVGPALGSTINRHPSSAGATAEGLRQVRADAVHARGLRGAGVDVGVIGRGFDATGVVAPHVVDRRQVGDRGRATAHDTAVAAVVSETAPAADLYLAGVGPTPTPEEYATAVAWLTDRGVDVVVDSGSYFPSVAADERRITAAAERATDRGVVFVTSAGNYANRHWAGAGTDSGWVTFADGDAANALADGAPVRGKVTVRLRWRSTADYDLYLYRRLPGAPDRVVAKSVGDATGPGLTVEGVDVAVPRGRYYVAVYADDPAETDDSGRVQVFAARHRLEHATAHGSMVAPATAENVVAVGAAADGERRAYSSLSATGSVDLTAPSGARSPDAPGLTGTSAAAPYVAGTAALMVSGEDDPSPARVESILERTADGDDSLDALAAVEAASGDAVADPSGTGWDGGPTGTGVADSARNSSDADGSRSGASDERGERSGTTDDRRDSSESDDRRDSSETDDRRDSSETDDRRDSSETDDRRDSSESDDRRNATGDERTESGDSTDRDGRTPSGE